MSTFADKRHYHERRSRLPTRFFIRTILIVVSVPEKFFELLGNGFSAGPWGIHGITSLLQRGYVRCHVIVVRGEFVDGLFPRRRVFDQCAAWNCDINNLFEAIDKGQRGLG